MGGSQGHFQSEVLPWLQAGASAVDQAGGSWQAASHPPQCRLHAPTSPLLRARSGGNPTWPPVWQGPMPI